VGIDNMIRLINTSAHDTSLSDQSLHMIATSPPYWGLRTYKGEQRIDWPAVEYAPMPGMPTLSIPAMTCGLGEETTPEAYIGHMILCLREWWRVLRDDGTCWVNLGDSYASSQSTTGGYSDKSTLSGFSSDNTKGRQMNRSENPTRLDSCLKPKNLCLIPARFALAAQADGWYIRSDIIWAKPNPMPESVTDRCTKAHEYVYLMAKSQKYFYDAEAVKEEASPETFARSLRGVGENHKNVNGAPGQTVHSMSTPRAHGEGTPANPTRNKRTVWNIATSPYSGAHFATWPPKLVEPMILAGTSARGVCPACGSPWERVVEKGMTAHDGETQSAYSNGTTANRLALLRQAARERGEEYTSAKKTTGWRATCECEAGDPIPATVLDPFNGSGTTGTVALDLGRAYIGVDISAEYVTGLAESRIGGTQIGFGL
jgi:DNA modification methylase